jgi:hypothetical protein
VVSFVEPFQNRDITRMHRDASVTATTDSVYAGSDAVRELAASGEPVVIKEIVEPERAPRAGGPGAGGRGRRPGGPRAGGFRGDSRGDAPRREGGFRGGSRREGGYRGDRGTTAAR